MRPDRPCQGSARVSASEREVSQHLPGRRPCKQPSTAAPPASPTAPLDWTTPSCTLPRTPTRKGGPTCGGSPLRPRPSSGQRRKHLGSKRNGAHPRTTAPSALTTGTPGAAPGKQPSTPVHQSTQGKPRPRTYRARGSLCDGQDATAPPGEKDRRSPFAHPAGHLRQRQTAAHQRKAIRQGQSPESIQTQPQATATDPPAYPTQGRAKAHNRQGNPPRTESNGSADCLNNRATPFADRTLIGRAAGKPQGSKVARRAEQTNTLLGPTACRTIGNDQAPRTGQSPP
ncbi:hypothetical protein WOLCODRAFT_156124 [Wolfiporia cocos MD-104 SS10]|uniref:Uncharacterized protein n=1 Tax=Wolfiporia cocos (strain MD-104) TaxID=742152 RepID=A0A2H3JHG1_WOLCO|nr:hypothetical protein WOLCODRAFT_156124 [Wolfiporia cocos MD-104 SS10]